MTLPTLFISHGAPNFVLYDTPARQFLTTFAHSLPRPKAILVMSAHFEADQTVLVADEKPSMIYDFSGFERELYAMRYDAPGARQLALEAAALANAAGYPAMVAKGRGYDHGTWIPLSLLYPAADIPVAQISVQPNASGHAHAALGRALAPLRDQGVLIIGSGSLTHNLRQLNRTGAETPAPDWVRAFEQWVRQKAEAGDIDAIADFMQSAPHAADNHPSDEHFLPFPFAFGAAGEGARGMRIHTSHSYGVLMMDAYRFDAVQ